MRDTWISFELDPPGETEMARRITDYGASHGWLVAEVDGVLAGYAYGSPHRTRAAYASSCDVAVYVDPAFARRGLGRALYGALIERMAGKYHAAYAGIALPNEVAPAFLFLACKDSSYMSGQVLHPNGGTIVNG